MDAAAPEALVVGSGLAGLSCALELARRYTGEEAIPFLNGVLDAVRKTLFPEAAAQSG